MRQLILLIPVLLLGVAAPAKAAHGLILFPPSVALDGPGDRQQLVLTETAKGRSADHTADATYATTAPGVATVSRSGVVTPAGDGEAIITATVNGATATVTVKVRNATTPKPVTFERDIQPILTRAGCNAGACHGKARGQNGFQLSLLAYDNDFDFNAITTEARGRRIFPANPSFSLLLRKASGQVPHGGGKKLPEGTTAYRTLEKWIAAGTARDVTDLAQFSSSEAVYAAVDENGKVKAGPIPGEAAIMARFAEKFAISTVRIPLPTPVPADVYEKLPRKNLIDGLVWAKLKQLNVTPS